MINQIKFIKQRLRETLETNPKERLVKMLDDKMIAHNKPAIFTKTLTDPKFSIIMPNEIVVSPQQGCEPNQCETNAWLVVKKNPEIYYPVGGFIIERTTPIEHWWVYDIKQNKHVDVTPLHPMSEISGYIGVINTEINNDIIESNKFYDVDFFKGGNPYFWYFK